MDIDVMRSGLAINHDSFAVTAKAQFLQDAPRTAIRFRNIDPHPVTFARAHTKP